MSSEKLKNMPNMNSLLKISIGLIIVAIISSAFVYAETTSVSIEGKSYDVEYTGIGVTVNGVDADLDFISLILLVDVSGTPGTLDITFDRSFFDSKYQGNDESFIVLADGDEPNYSEIETNSKSRTISIELPNGTEEVEIIGSVFGDSPEPPVEEPIVVEPPVEEPIVVEPPVEEPIVVEPPVEEPIVVEPPVEEPIVVEPPVEEPIVVEPPVEETLNHLKSQQRKNQNQRLNVVLELFLKMVFVYLIRDVVLELFLKMVYVL